MLRRSTARLGKSIGRYEFVVWVQEDEAAFCVGGGSPLYGNVAPHIDTRNSGSTQPARAGKSGPVVERDRQCSGPVVRLYPEVLYQAGDLEALAKLDSRDGYCAFDSLADVANLAYF